MIALDGLELFASGPCELVPGSWQRRQIRRGIPGRDGEVVLDLGARGRSLRQSGRLQAETPAALEAIIGQIVALQDGSTHTLRDNHGLQYANVVLQSFELTTPVTIGRGAWADYIIEYFQPHE